MPEFCFPPSFCCLCDLCWGADWPEATHNSGELCQVTGGVGHGMTWWGTVPHLWPWGVINLVHSLDVGAFWSVIWKFPTRELQWGPPEPRLGVGWPTPALVVPFLLLYHITPHPPTFHPTNHCSLYPPTSLSHWPLYIAIHPLLLAIHTSFLSSLLIIHPQIHWVGLRQDPEGCWMPHRV